MVSKTHGFERKLCFLLVKSGLTPTDLEFRYLSSKSVKVNFDLVSKTHGFERKLCLLKVTSGLTSTDLELRYLNSKSVGVNPDSVSKTHGFERKLCFLFVKLEINPKGFGVQVTELQIR